MARTRIVRTVTGDILPAELGVTSAHEHVLCDLRSKDFTPPDDPDVRARVTEPLRIDNLWWIREHHLESQPNLVLDEVEVAVSELVQFRHDGGRSMIDVTCHGLGRRPIETRDVAERADVQIVLGCGYYVESSHPEELRETTVDQIAQSMIADLTVGMDGSDIRAGVIGEVGCSWPVTEEEQRVLHASALAHAATGAAVVVHTGRHASAGLDHVERLGRLGVAPERVVISHVDRRIDVLADALQLARTGCYLAFDCFGLEPWIAPAARGMPMPCDLERAVLLRGLCEAGFSSQLLVAQDIAMKHRLCHYGGHGYSHLLRWGLPLLQHVGLTEEECARFVIDNPMAVFWMDGDASSTTHHNGDVNT